MPITFTKRAFIVRQGRLATQKAMVVIPPTTVLSHELKAQERHSHNGRWQRERAGLLLSSTNIQKHAPGGPTDVAVSVTSLAPVHSGPFRLKNGPAGVQAARLPGDLALGFARVVHGKPARHGSLPRANADQNFAPSPDNFSPAECG